MQERMRFENAFQRFDLKVLDERCKWHLKSVARVAQTRDRGKEVRLVSDSLPSEPCVRVSRTRLSG